MAVVIPDETLYAAHLTAAELKQELAVLLFERDRLTLMQAAELAEMRPIPFQHLLAAGAFARSSIGPWWTRRAWSSIPAKRKRLLARWKSTPSCC
ncbi:MAG: hypothetical protein EA420_16970 [Candidatus Competibacteraceae bacterium]|nr:MAG: hypothetical protein EA420_16970 [Candidatus Competibacteraceae bacterium]